MDGINKITVHKTGGMGEDWKFMITTKNNMKEWRKKLKEQSKRKSENIKENPETVGKIMGKIVVSDSAFKDIIWHI